MVFRVLIVAQVTFIALLGAMTRADLLPLPPSSQWWMEAVTALIFYPVAVGFPVAIVYASRRAEMPRWKRRMVLGIEVVLVFATLLAILPAVQ